MSSARVLLFDVLKAREQLAQLPGFAEAETELLTQVMDESAKFVAQRIAPLHRLFQITAQRRRQLGKLQLRGETLLDGRLLVLDDRLKLRTLVCVLLHQLAAAVVLLYRARLSHMGFTSA